MGPLHAAALVAFVLLLSAAATLVRLGTWRFAVYLRDLAKKRSPNR